MNFSLPWPRRARRYHRTGPADPPANQDGLPAADRLPGRLPRRRRDSPLTRRILAVNLLALAILVAGVLYLGRYRDRLIQAEMEALQTEGRLIAGALAEAVLAPEGDGEDLLAAEPARRMVRRLSEATDCRTRLFDRAGQLVADSRVLGGPGGLIQMEELPAPPAANPLTRWADWLYEEFASRVPGRGRLPLYTELAEQNAHHYPDVERALDGDLITGAWWHGEHGLLITATVPVKRFKQVVGAVLLSRNGTLIDRSIRSVRVDILRVVAGSLGITVLLSLYLAGTIARPIRRLALAAERVGRGQGRPPAIPDFSRRGDEIGDLSRALREMTAALWARMDAIERFAADVAHEIKNPLSSLRSAVETVGRIEDAERRARLMAIIEDDVQRLDRLISDISNASRLDAELSRAETKPVDLAAMLGMLAEIHQATATPDQPRLVLELPSGPGPGNGAAAGGGSGAVLRVPGLADRLVQVFQNLIANALSFSPAGGAVTVALRLVSDDWVEVTVADQGPGIPEGKLEAIFDRFYSERPAGEKFGTHSGLGLSISRQIVAAHGGQLYAANRLDRAGQVCGALFTVRLPRR